MDDINGNLMNNFTFNMFIDEIKDCKSACQGKVSYDVVEMCGNWFSCGKKSGNVGKIGEKLENFTKSLKYLKKFKQF